MPGGFKSNKSKTGKANVNERWRRALEEDAAGETAAEPEAAAIVATAAATT